MRYLLPMLVALAACGGGPTVPDSGTIVPTSSTLPPLAVIPAYFEGFYVRAEEAHEPPGNMHILLASWEDDMSLSQVPVMLSVHCCMWTGDWKFTTQNWDRILTTWIIPLRKRGMLAGIYLVDEPEGYGISYDEVAKANNFFAERGYPTMSASVSRHESRLPVDYWSMVAYSWDTKKEWARDLHRTSDTDWIVGQAFDGGIGYEKGIPDQVFWRQTAREVGKGIISWVWRWPGQEGCGDNPECIDAWR